MQRFQHTADAAVDGRTRDGRGKLSLVPHRDRQVSRLVCRDVTSPLLSEHELLAHIAQVFEAAGLIVPRSLLVSYYISLKTNPFVVLAGRDGSITADFAALFAEALLGRDSSQYALIPAGAPWPSATGEHGYYRDLRARFASLRFLDLLQDAASPAGVGRPYLVCFTSLQPDEVSYYFTSLLRVDDAGQKRLMLPGLALEDCPVVPPNVYITATLDTVEEVGRLDRQVLRHAALIQLQAVERSEAPAARLHAPLPVGYQRLWLRSAIRDVDVARQRLAKVLGPDALQRLRCSGELQRLLWRGGVVIGSRELQELTIYVAASFDETGRGLFVPSDARRNAQIAFDAQVVQRVLWKLRDTLDGELRRDLARFFDRLTPPEVQQAVA